MNLYYHIISNDSLWSCAGAIFVQQANIPEGANVVDLQNLDELLVCLRFYGYPLGELAETQDQIGDDLANYEQRGEGWFKVRFSKKDFLLWCGDDNIDMLIELCEDKDSPFWKKARRILMLITSADCISVNDPDIIMLVRGLTAIGLPQEEADRILAGKIYERPIMKIKPTP